MPKRVLVVDDLPYLRDVQVLLLNEAGYVATAIGTAMEALERLPDLDPHLILLDMSMPEMDGRQFLAELRASQRWATLPVIISTGMASEDIDRTSTVDVLPKPFSDVALIERVRSMIGDA